MVRVPGATAGPVVPAAKASELLKRARTAGMPSGSSNPQDADGVRPARSTPSWRLWSYMVGSNGLVQTRALKEILVGGFVVHKQFPLIRLPRSHRGEVWCASSWLTEAENL